MSALLGRLTNQPPDQVLGLLNEAVEAHFKCVRGMIFGYDYLTVLNPDFVGDLVKEYLLYAPNDPVQKGQAVPPALKQVQLILETVTRACPGLRDALFLVSKARYLSGDIKASLNTLQHIGNYFTICTLFLLYPIPIILIILPSVDNLDPTMAEAHLLIAQIQVHEGNYLSAQQNLEVGLSYNFEVRDHPIFHLINAKVQKDQGNTSEAEKTLKKALELALKDHESSRKGPKQTDSKKIAFTTADLATIYLELADRYLNY